MLDNMPQPVVIKATVPQVLISPNLISTCFFFLVLDVSQNFVSNVLSLQLMSSMVNVNTWSRGYCRGEWAIVLIS